MNGMNHNRAIYFLPAVAFELGLNAAIVLGQLQTVLDGEGEDAPCGWVRLSHERWLELLPFWSKDTIKRAIWKLEKAGSIESTTELNETRLDRTKWYRIHGANLLQSGQASCGKGDCHELHQTDERVL